MPLSVQTEGKPNNYSMYCFRRHAIPLPVCCKSLLCYYMQPSTNVKLDNLLTGEPLSDDIPIERSPVYSAGPQSPTAATGGDGQEKKNEEREPDD